MNLRPSSLWMVALIHFLLLLNEIPIYCSSLLWLRLIVTDPSSRALKMWHFCLVIPRCYLRSVSVFMPLPFIVDSKPLFRKSNHFSLWLPGCCLWEFTAILFVLSLFWEFSKRFLHSFHLGWSPNSALNLLLLSSECISTTQRSYDAIFFTQGLWLHGCRLYLEVLYCL